MDQFPIMGVPDGGDTAWMLVSSALVLLMTPGLAFSTAAWCVPRAS
ncbi:ammonium transporter integral membrane protein [Mycobacterium tuberculosis variant bovis BCG]|nr:ammonium transporter integral membrane protein [Mycobacterium tuberculosis variant bovis BCG]